MWYVSMVNLKVCFSLSKMGLSWFTLWYLHSIGIQYLYVENIYLYVQSRDNCIVNCIIFKTLLKRSFILINSSQTEVILKTFLYFKAKGPRATFFIKTQQCCILMKKTLMAHPKNWKKDVAKSFFAIKERCRISATLSKKLDNVAEISQHFFFLFAQSEFLQNDFPVAPHVKHM